MKTNIFAFSERGSALALRISGYYENCEIHSVEKFAVPHGFTAHKSVCADMGELFREAGLLIFIGACGIAPAVSINGKVYPKMTPEKVPDVIREYAVKEVLAK